MRSATSGAIAAAGSRSQPAQQWSTATEARAVELLADQPLDLGLVVAAVSLKLASFLPDPGPAGHERSLAASPASRHRALAVPSARSLVLTGIDGWWLVLGGISGDRDRRLNSIFCAGDRRLQT